MCRDGILAVGLALLALGCGGKSPEPPPRPAQPAPAPAVDETVSHGENERLERELENARAALASAEDDRRRLEQFLAERAAELMALEEAHAGLELELASALEELLRAQASLRHVQSRAFAVSRIAEARVELESIRRSKDRALASRIERADEFLTRADQALAENNVGGAAYLADRAGELLRQARTVAELRKKQPREIIPIVPARVMEVQTNANLRSEPSRDSARLGRVDSGAVVEAVARQGEWFRVVSDGGVEAWIHRTLVR